MNHTEAIIRIDTICAWVDLRKHTPEEAIKLIKIVLKELG